MGMWILHDGDHERAVIYDSCYERPFGPGFVGDDAAEQAEVFLAYAVRRIGVGTGSRGGRAPLDVTRDEWEALHDDFVARAYCVACGGFAVDESLLYSDEEIGRALDQLGVARRGEENAPPVERLCHGCHDGEARERHAGALGPAMDEEEDEEDDCGVTPAPTEFARRGTSTLHPSTLYPDDGKVHVRRSVDAPSAEPAWCGKRYQSTITDAWGAWGPGGKLFDQVCSDCVAAKKAAAKNSAVGS